MELDDFDRLWERHPAWKLLRARNAPLVLSFLGRFFIEGNRGATPVGELTAALDDQLYAIHRSTPERFDAEPVTYLENWAAPESGWVRRFYPSGSEEVHYEATPALEKAYRWVESLQAREFIGTESRLHILVDLLRQIVHGSETDPASRIEELERRRDAIESELADAREGRFAIIDGTGVRDRYQQFSQTAREMLGDFREVEDNLRGLDRSAREKIAAWDGGKGELLENLVATRTGIAASDQGRSFQAFYDFLLSEDRQVELSELLESVQQMPDVGADRRLRSIHHDWAEAAERTQQTVRNLSEQLRRFLEDQIWVENRRVMDLARAVEAVAIVVREAPPRGDEVGLFVDEPGLPITLPFERPLYDSRPDVVVDSLLPPEPVDAIEMDALFAQRFVDKARLADNIRAIVPRRSTAALEDIIALYPVEDGVSEILGYLTLDGEEMSVVVGGEEIVIEYTDADNKRRRVRMPRVTVTRR